MPRPLRLAVLECDTPISEVKQVYGSYGDIFKNLLQRSAETIGYDQSGLLVTKWDVVEKQIYPKMEDIDAILLTGSRHNCFENDLWILKLVAFVEHLLKKQDRIRVVGICFGHQIVARALGAEVGRNNRGWELSVIPVELTDHARYLFGSDMKEISLQQMHRDVVHTLPVGVMNLGHSPVCEIQGMFTKNQLCTFQGHPEFNEEIVREILKKRREQDIFDEQTYDEAIGRVKNGHQGLLNLMYKQFAYFAQSTSIKSFKG